MRKLLNEELDRKSIEEFKSSQKTPVILVLDNVRSLNNIGSIFRTADAFLLEAIYLCGITATPPNKDIQKTALGATETVNWKYFKTTIEAVQYLKAADYSIFAIEQAENSIMLNDFHPPDKLALVFGNEVKGVDQEVVNLCDQTVEIPQKGSKHSLNIAVCAGIAIWDVCVKMKNV